MGLKAGQQFQLLQKDIIYENVIILKYNRLHLPGYEMSLILHTVCV